MPSSPLVVFGVSSSYAWEVVESARRRDIEVVCVDNHGASDARLPGLVRLADHPERGPFTLGLASARHRRYAAHAAHQAAFDQPVALVDPSAVVAGTAVVGHGVYVNAGAVVASHAVLGCHAHVNRSASIGHDTILGFGASIGPGAVLAGHVEIGAGAFVGTGAAVLPEIHVGLGAVVGAGAVVTRDVEDHVVVVGNPARLLRRQESDAGDTVCPHC